MPIDGSKSNTTPDVSIALPSNEHAEDGSVSTPCPNYAQNVRTLTSENEHAIDRWIREENDKRQKTYGDRFGQCSVTMVTWDEMCNRAHQAGAALPPDAAYKERMDAVKDTFTQFFESQNLFLEDTRSVWERIKYYMKGLTSGLIGEDEYKQDYLGLRGYIGNVHANVASLRQRYVAQPEQLHLHDRNIAGLLLWLFATIMWSEDLLRMSGAPMATYRVNISHQLSKVAMEWQDTWLFGDYGKAVNAEKLAAIANIVEQTRSLVDTVEKGIDANDASKFRIFLVLINLFSVLGAWFYGYVVPEMTTCSVEACDTLLEQSQHWSLAANTTIG